MSQQVIYVDGLGFIPIESGQTPQQAIAQAQSTTPMSTHRPAPTPDTDGRFGVTGGPGQFAGLDLSGVPPEMREAIGAALKAAPQLAAFLVQLKTGGRFGLANSVLTPMATRAGTNALEGKPIGDDVVNEGVWGVVAGTPAKIGGWLTKRGVEGARHALGTSPRISALAQTHGKNFVESELPRRALATRAAATHTGVDTATDRAVSMSGEAQDAMRNARDLLTGIPHPSQSELAMADEAMAAARGLRTGAEKEHALANVLEDLRYSHSMRGSQNALGAIVPGSGIVTTATRATGATPALGQAIAPVVGALKGSPARRLAVARNLHAPGGVAESDAIGEVLSQLLRLGLADRAAGTDLVPLAVSHIQSATGARPKRRRP